MGDDGLSPEVVFPLTLIGRTVVAAGFLPSLAALRMIELTFDDGTVMGVLVDGEVLEVTVEGPNLMRRFQ